MAAQVAREVGFRHEWVESHEHERSEYARNAPDRCYFCKTELFELLEALRGERGFAAVAYGINRDDTGDFRPGHTRRGGAPRAVAAARRAPGQGRDPRAVGGRGAADRGPAGVGVPLVARARTAWR